MHERDKSKINAKGSDSFESLNPIRLQMWSVEQIKQNVFLPFVTKHVLRFYFMIYYKKITTLMIKWHGLFFKIFFI
jgi:hypothetical protein